MKTYISSRWTPQHVERRDTTTGHFEEVNSRVVSHSELVVQRALLLQVSDSVRRREQRILKLRSPRGAA